jgi:glucose/arabinose dehydrogenase
MKIRLLLFLSSFIFFKSYAQLPQLNLVLVKQGFDSPVDIKHCGDDRLFIVQQDGLIRIMDKSGNINATPFLDIDAKVNSTNNEQGLLGLAFSPNYKQDGYFYVNYTAGTGAGSTRISRFSVNPTDSNLADSNSEVVLLTFTQPYSNHNGGNMMFGKDGYLYISQGDGGSSGDPNGNGQNKNTYLGKLLRIDVTGQTTYAVPLANPFVGQSNVKEEIWAYGLRNPWRCSFDRVTGDLWIGDVGQDSYEEIDFQDAASAGGENYGWKCREGLHPTPLPTNTTGCPSTGFVDPVYEVPQSGGTSCSITGGYVYRGAQYNKLFGLYLFTDYCSGKFWSLKRTGANSFDPDTLQTFFPYQFTSFGEDNNGELYIAYRCSTSTCGRIYRITETTDCNPVAFISLQDTIGGCAPVRLTALKGDTINYVWYNSSGPINGANSYSYTAAQSGWYKVKVAKQQAGCESMSDSVFVQIFDTTVLATPNTIFKYCSDDSTVSVNGIVVPEGGSFNSPYVSNDTLFNPAIAGVGNIALPYVYANANGCVSSLTATVVVGGKTPLSVDSNNVTVCESSTAFPLAGFVSPIGGTYSGSGVSNNEFTPTATSTITYTYLNDFGCESEEVFMIQVNTCVGMNEVQSRVNFHLFPNPAGEELTIKLEGKIGDGIELMITDAVGKVCFAGKYGLNAPQVLIPVNVQQFASGVYTVLLKNMEYAAVKKLIVD